MRYLHTMLRVEDLDAALAFYCGGLGLVETRRYENEGGRFTLVFLAAPEDADRAKAEQAPLVELTYNWPAEDGTVETLTGGRNFGHLAYQVDDIYATCAHLQAQGITILLDRFACSWISANTWVALSDRKSAEAAKFDARACF